MLAQLSLAALQPLRPPSSAELAYNDLVTVSPSATAAEATSVFQRYGIVRVPAVLSADQTSELVAEDQHDPVRSLRRRWKATGKWWHGRALPG